MVELFFDPQVSCFPEWKVERGPGCGFSIEQNWAAADFRWASKPASGLVEIRGENGIATLEAKQGHILTINFSPTPIVKC